MTETLVRSLDLKGLSCPMPIIQTACAIRSLAPGDLVEVFATDPGSVPDFDAWTKATGNTLVEQTERDGVFRFVLKKG
jgi:tRNA 2-thiouridine synthesizing protein A